MEFVSEFSKEETEKILKEFLRSKGMLMNDLLICCLICACFQIYITWIMQEVLYTLKVR